MTMSAAKPYLHIRCRNFALLMATDQILEIVKLETTEQSQITWREKQVSCQNLSKKLLPHQNIENHHALVIEPTPSEYSAILVEEVANIEAISENDFMSLPSLNFQYNDYFDKAYIHPDTKQCIYRLKLGSFIESFTEG